MRLSAQTVPNPGLMVLFKCDVARRTARVLFCVPARRCAGKTGRPEAVMPSAGSGEPHLNSFSLCLCGAGQESLAGDPSSVWPVLPLQPMAVLWEW